MKKFLVLVSVFIAYTSFNLMAIGNNSLLPNYFDRMLFIETKGVTTFSDNDNTSYTYTMGNGSVTVNNPSAYRKAVTETYWEPLMGDQKISRTEFFRITEQQEYLDRYLSYERQKRGYEIGKYISYGILGASAIFGAISVAMWSKYDEDKNTAAAKDWKTCTYVAAGVALASVVPICILTYTAPNEPDVSVNFAITLANSYNKKNGYVL